jgi:hypothetical protein
VSASTIRHAAHTKVAFGSGEKIPALAAWQMSQLWWGRAHAAGDATTAD